MQPVPYRLAFPLLTLALAAGHAFAQTPAEESPSAAKQAGEEIVGHVLKPEPVSLSPCLLYTSDAADE